MGGYLRELVLMRGLFWNIANRAAIFELTLRFDVVAFGEMLLRFFGERLRFFGGEILCFFGGGILCFFGEGIRRSFGVSFAFGGGSVGIGFGDWGSASRIFFSSHESRFGRVSNCPSDCEGHRLRPSRRLRATCAGALFAMIGITRHELRLLWSGAALSGQLPKSEGVFGVEPNQKEYLKHKIKEKRQFWKAKIFEFFKNLKNLEILGWESEIWNLKNCKFHTYWRTFDEHLYLIQKILKKINNFEKLTEKCWRILLELILRKMILGNVTFKI